MRMMTRVLLLFWIVPWCLGGCTLLALQEELVVFDKLADLKGTVHSHADSQKPIIVVIYEQQHEGPKVVDYIVRYLPGPFHFKRLPGRCYIAAFEDANEDFVYQPGERAGYYGNPTPLEPQAGKEMPDLDITLHPADEVVLDIPIDLASSKGKSGLALQKAAIGEVTPLDDPRFSAEYGPMGLWEPIRMIQEVGAGIYFLEPYDATKIPVLFVHGAKGYPQEWTYLVDQIDRTRFQPWVYHYPSGARLGSVSDWLIQAMTELHVKHKFKHFAIVAHSMGGLVTRPLVNQIAQHDVKDFLKLYVTLSTPWAGHSAARLGVNYSPAVIPSWLDIMPGSPYQETVLSVTLPDHIPHYLFFSFGGKASFFATGKDDGTVSLASQLDPRAQEAAVKIFGFNESHVNILSSPVVAAKVNQLLEYTCHRSHSDQE